MFGRENDKTGVYLRHGFSQYFFVLKFVDCTPVIIRLQNEFHLFNHALLSIQLLQILKTDNTIEYKSIEHW